MEEPMTIALSGTFPAASLPPAGYVRRSSPLQTTNFSLEAQKRGIAEECARRGLLPPVFYIDDERSARGEQIAQRPAFQHLLQDVQAGRVQVVLVHTFDRWSRNVLVTLQSFRILAENQAAFISISEHIDYATPEGRLQLTILAAFAAFFSEMLTTHVRKGKHQRALCDYPGGMSVSFLELLLYTMRHVQEHAAQLSLFLGQHGVPDEALDWVARAKDEPDS